MSTETTDARVPSPADWRGFSVAADGVTRRYLLPRGLLRGAAAERVIEAGAALPLAGGAIAFCFVEVAERRAGKEGERHPLALSQVADKIFDPSPYPSPARGEGTLLSRPSSIHLAEQRKESPSPLAGEGRGEGSTGLSALLQQLQQPRPRWAGFDLAKPLIMGVVNVTPDSFSDGGDFASAEDAIAQGIRLAEQGADIIDIGGESTRPGAAAVSAEEEIRRVVPVVRALAERGLCVSRPFDSLPFYDAIVDNGSRLFRVQIKGARPTTRSKKSGATQYRVNTNRNGVRRMKFDVAAVWLAADGRWVFLPGRLAKKKLVNLTPNGRYSRRGWEVFSRS